MTNLVGYKLRLQTKSVFGFWVNSGMTNPYSDATSGMLMFIDKSKRGDGDHFQKFHKSNGQNVDKYNWERIHPADLSIFMKMLGET